MKVFCEWWDLLVPISYKKMFYVMCEAFDKAWLFFALLFFKKEMRSYFKFCKEYREPSGG